MCSLLPFDSIFHFSLCTRRAFFFIHSIPLCLSVSLAHSMRFGENIHKLQNLAAYHTFARIYIVHFVHMWVPLWWRFFEQVRACSAQCQNTKYCIVALVMAPYLYACFLFQCVFTIDFDWVNKGWWVRRHRMQNGPIRVCIKMHKNSVTQHSKLTHRSQNNQNCMHFCELHHFQLILIQYLMLRTYVCVCVCVWAVNTKI